MKRSYKFANSLVKAYGKQSIFYKYWKKIFLYTLIPFIILCLSIYDIVSYNTEQRLLTSLTSEFEKSLLLLDNQFKDLNDYHLSLNEDKYVNLFILSPSTDSDFYSQYNIDDSVKHTLKFRVLSSPAIKAINLYSFINNNIFSTETMGYTPLNSNITWIDKYEELNEQIIILPEANNCFRIIFPISTYNVTDGLISIEIDGNQFCKSINTFSSDVQFCLYNNSTKTTLLGDSTLVDKFDLTHDNSTFKEENDYIFHAKTSFNDIHIIVKCENVHQETSTPILLIITACILVSLTLSTALSFYLSMQLYNSIAVITGEIQTNFGENGITGGTSNELKYISSKLMELEDKNKATEKELVNKISSLRLYQTVMLQNQFNPHFIFNTLNSVTMILLNQDLTDERPVEMISLLSSLMHVAINTEHYIISLENELKYSQTYIQLEKIKQKNNFDVEYDIDTTLLSQNTIKFILQPILENAFEHGIKKIYESKSGKISLTLRKEENNILISVSDNGPGMTESTLKKLLIQLQEEDLLSSKHIGLCNTNNRIKIYYGDDFGITNIKSDENGTTVQILIPYDPSDNQYKYSPTK